MEILFIKAIEDGQKENAQELLKRGLSVSEEALDAAGLYSGTSRLKKFMTKYLKLVVHPEKNKETADARAITPIQRKGLSAFPFLPKAKPSQGKRVSGSSAAR